MRNHAVVLTYPEHFLLTSLTIQSLKKHFPEVTQITVLADDINNNSWRRYIDDCKSKYNENVIPLSTFKLLDKFASNGWVRQQMVKLHIDVLLNIDSCFFVDGDIGFTSHILPGATPFAYLQTKQQTDKSRNHTQCQEQYLLELLGISRPRTWNSNRRLCTSVVAFRDLNASILRSLRQHVEQRFNTNFIDLHYELSNDPAHYSISEWELIENYKIHVLNQLPNWLYCQPRDYKNYFDPLPNEHSNSYFYTCYTGDSGLSPEWWQKMNNFTYSVLTY